VSDDRSEAQEQQPPCPICGRPRLHRYRPFCSARCRDVDLGRWFGEVYTVPAVEPGYDEDEAPDAPDRDDGRPS
jgi:endogenous inhibitor of DNA gyrase (YacG/DUF329 family)